MRGRKPTPTGLKLLHGNPGHRPLPANEPVLEPAPTDPPKGLKGDARAEWGRLCGPLTEAGVLTVADLFAFEQYCRLRGEVREVERLIARMGREPATKLGYPRELYKLREQARKYAVELGITPSARARVRAQPKPAGTSASKDFLLGRRPA